MLVSVVIPAYNSVYVRDAIVSILNQTHQDLDVIVVDDGSPGDAIQSICAEFPEVRYIRQANAGPSAGRNRGIREAKGEWIAFLDDDDIWLPQKIEKQLLLVAQSTARERIGLIYTGQYLFQDEIDLGSKIDEANGMIYPYLLFGNFIGSCSSVMIPKHVFNKVGVFDESLICSQDYELYLRIAREFEVRSVSEALIRYRTRPDQISKDPTLNNADDEEILRLQEPYLSAELYKQVREFHRSVASLRYKEKAYDCLFRIKDRRAYWLWMWRSSWVILKIPSAASLAYLALTVAPESLIDLVASMRRGSVGKLKASGFWFQDVAKDFVWMGVQRGDIRGTCMATKDGLLP